MRRTLLRAAVILSVAATVTFGVTGCQPASEPPPTSPESSTQTPSPEEVPEEVPVVEPDAVPAAENIDGYWCPTAESNDSYGCVTITLPTATYDSGNTRQLNSIGEKYGGFGFSSPGAPFGTYYPAGIAIEIPSYYPGVDLPDQDRVWNGQTGTMLLRQ